LPLVRFSRDYNTSESGSVSVLGSKDERHLLDHFLQEELTSRRLFSLCLRKETDSAFETLYSLQYWMIIVKGKSIPVTGRGGPKDYKT
jgi:hypothetical protein